MNNYLDQPGTMSLSYPNPDVITEDGWHMPEEKKYKRWYDKYPNISSLVEMSKDLPLTAQRNLGENLIQTIKRYQYVMQSSLELKNLGAEMVLGLFKSRRKQRWYDDIPELHKAYNMLAVLPAPVLHHLDIRCGDLVHYIMAHKKSRSLTTFNLATMINDQLRVDNDVFTEIESISESMGIRSKKTTNFS